ncbi:hypothetical protein FF36_00179 [Frankia torreyi]|uniref:Uncharacterized protein n=1 Tax=Frankia torreyi TaxID=1856 RepID=A0A0D8BMW8_9ACTN|nr:MULTISPECIES: hypothetical protein [Frankia]KJE25563.1 hypothetical protein FF36_00179 [Frankia torreyi]KQM06207.1 hypothetical protein FF86_101084 [Frankia sp. CpI1-P]
MPAASGAPAPGGFTVGEWARDIDAARWQVLHDAIDEHGHWRPGHTTAYADAQAAATAALRTVALHLGVPLAQVGPCGSCAAFCHLYGPSGNPLCPRCLAAARAAAARAAARAAAARAAAARVEAARPEHRRAA